MSQHPLPPTRHQPHLLIPSAQTLNQENKESKNEIQLPTNHIVCLGHSTQNAELREVDLELILKRGSDKNNMKKEGRNTQKNASRIVQPGLSYGLQQLER